MNQKLYLEDLERRKKILEILEWDKNPQHFTDYDYGEDRLEFCLEKLRYPSKA